MPDLSRDLQDAYERSGLADLERRLDAAEQRAEKAERQLRDAWLAELYDKDGAGIWIVDAEQKGQSISEQLQRLDQLRTGAMG